jgi:rSAM/selenodomain-associated transferase 1
MRPAILLFVKYPEPGRVKNRLAMTLGAKEAARIYETLVGEICAKLPADAEVIVVYDPAERSSDVERWLNRLLPRARFRPQCTGDLGVRLSGAFDYAFSQGLERVAAIGSDCVEISAKTFSAAWKALDSHDVVIGPATDGGYYLIALKSPSQKLFQAIPWSTEQTFTATVERAREAKMTVFLLPMLRDVDHEEDWKMARAHLSSYQANRPLNSLNGPD